MCCHLRVYLPLHLFTHCTILQLKITCIHCYFFKDVLINTAINYHRDDRKIKCLLHMMWKYHYHIWMSEIAKTLQQLPEKKKKKKSALPGSTIDFCFIWIGSPLVAEIRHCALSKHLVCKPCVHTESVMPPVCITPLWHTSLSDILTTKLPVIFGWKTLSKEHWEKRQLLKEKISDMLLRQCS